MATIAEIKELALHAAKGTAPANFSEKNVNDALRGEMAAMCSSINEFRRNQYGFSGCSQSYCSHGFLCGD